MANPRREHNAGEKYFRPSRKRRQRGVVPPEVAGGVLAAVAGSGGSPGLSQQEWTRGRIEEIGTHESLMDLNGLYSRFLRLQAVDSFSPA